MSSSNESGHTYEWVMSHTHACPNWESNCIRRMLLNMCGITCVELRITCIRLWNYASLNMCRITHHLTCVELRITCIRLWNYASLNMCRITHHLTCVELRITCIRRMWELNYIRRMSLIPHVTHVTDPTRHTCQFAMLRVSMSHTTFKWVMSHVSMSRVTYQHLPNLDWCASRKWYM